MAELSIVHTRWCITNQYWRREVPGSNGVVYVVEWKRVPGPYQYDYTCTCPASKFNHRRYCKHIEAVKHEHCQWNHEACCGSFEDTTGLEKCPKCGEKLVGLSVGV